MVTVEVPATSANLGSGFDSLGLSLTLANRFVLEEYDGLSISSGDGVKIPQNSENLVYKTAKQVYDLCGRPFHGLRLTQYSPIPMARGLGSSSACIVGGLLGANTLLGGPLSTGGLLDLAASIEGHPDNVAPALLGGFVVSAMEDGRVYTVKKEVKEGISFGAFIPDFPLLTQKARDALPSTVPHKDGVYNLSRAALCAAAFCEGRYDLLQVACRDRLHQQYRLPLIDGGESVFDLARDLGAITVFVSGAGPTILAVVPGDHQEFYSEAQRQLASDPRLARFSLMRLMADNQGARTIVQ